MLNARPLKGHLITQDLRHRFSDALIRSGNLFSACYGLTLFIWRRASS